MTDIFAQPAESAVKLSQELIRVHGLPRRIWTSEAAAKLADDMTEVLKTSTGTMSLRPLQAVALYEIGTEGGLFGPQRVGFGKTLISFLAPVVAFSQRPLLVIPAKLVKKTERDRETLAQHWLLPEFLRIVTYEWLGRAQASEFLEQFFPDLVILDEAHKARNIRKAAVARRLRRLFSGQPGVKCVAMSGTITKRSLYDYAHMVRWCLPAEKMPLPRHYQDLELWADALDERKGQTKRADPGMLQILCNDDEQMIWTSDSRRAARMAFRRRLVETAGIVATHETSIDATLTIQSAEPHVSTAVVQAFDGLRADATLPDGKECMDGLEIYRHARELALGFYYRWDPWPPREWLLPRKAWAKFVREVLKHSRQWDSELQVRRAFPDSKELAAWLAVKDTFEPNTVPVWLDESVLKFCAAWASENSGIVWTEHTVFGERLASDYGLTYYGKKGRSAAGGLIEDHPPGESLVASIQSNSEGRNLQAWSQGLITSMPPNGGQTEQLLGRLHRDGQQADEVEFDVLCTCAEHVIAFWQSHADCEYVQATTGSPQKLLIAGINVTTADDLSRRESSRWHKYNDDNE